MRSSITIAAFVVASACGDTTRGRDPLGPGLETAPAADGAEPSTTDAPDDDDGAGSGELLDLGAADREGCRAADLLFVIDNSGSMCDAQEGLASALPGLVDAMFDGLPPDTDLHVGITTTSFTDGGSHQESACMATEGPGTIAAAYVTDAYVEGNGFQGRLFEHDGQRYFQANTSDAEDRDALETWFSGAVVAVGCDGGAFEFPSAAAGYALAPGNAEANAGFVRDAGAALAIFVLTNEVDHSLESIATYRDMVLDAKAECGGEACVVTAGLLPPNCVPAANPIVWQFLSAFGTTPVWGDIGDFAAYGDVVSTALGDALVQTCEDLPVG